MSIFEGFMVPDDCVGAEYECEDCCEMFFGPFEPEGCECGGKMVLVRDGVRLIRLSAPGYLDATDWGPWESREDSESFLEYYGDPDDEDYDKDLETLERTRTA